MWGYDYYTRREPVNVQRKLNQLRKENPDISPVTIAGRKIATTWWGIAWNKNLESYADYASRIGRGRSYVRGGNVLDLQISPGVITAQVQGSDLYQVIITVKPLPKAKWDAIVAKCSRKVASLEELAAGKFPQALEELFTAKGEGLFPSPREISFDCSCPDWADMCKHVAATLYGVGNRLDTDPTLFFQLRGVAFGELLKKSVDEKMESMLKNAGTKSQRVLADADINQLFGLYG
ncbi:MAG: hypothetical protein LBS10_01015 [Gracilibacteraceae bacterium]|nr:hypothetical protein [Gracilibacteraceae bacterium]